MLIAADPNRVDWLTAAAAVAVFLVYLSQARTMKRQLRREGILAVAALL